MTTLFSSPKTPQIPAPAAPPTIDQAAVAADEADRLRARKGRSSTLLSPNYDDTSSAKVNQKTLLGS